MKEFQIQSNCSELLNATLKMFGHLTEMLQFSTEKQKKTKKEKQTCSVIVSRISHKTILAFGVTTSRLKIKYIRPMCHFSKDYIQHSALGAQNDISQQFLTPHQL